MSAMASAFEEADHPRNGVGKFVEKEHSEPGALELPPGEPARPDLSAWTPIDVDIELARLYGDLHRVESRHHSMDKFVNGEIARLHFKRGFKGTCTWMEQEEVIKTWRAQDPSERPLIARDILRHWAEVEEYDEQASELEAEMSVYEDEFTRRGGWNRAFLVSNTNGHVHSSMRCSTCFPTTRYHWVVEMSDHDEAEIVDAAGERACTVCYPSAPTASLSRPTSLFTPGEVAAQKAREERAAAKVKRDADRIAKGLTPDGSEFEVVSHGYRERFKTERAATTWAVDQVAGFRTWRRDEMPEDTAAGVESVIKAVATKHGKTLDETRSEIEKKVAAKIKRDGYAT